MIIIEGMDNSGKTTLARRLAKDLELLYINNRKKTTGLKTLDRDVYNFTRLSTIYNTVFDRWSAISEPVYGSVLRGTTYLEEDKRQLHQYCLQANPLVIYCRPSDETILKFGDEPQMEGVIQRAKDLILAYDQEIQFVSKTLATCGYDYEQHEYSQVREIIINHLQGAIH